MKKAIVLSATALLILFIAFVGIAARPLFGASADALAGETNVRRRGDGLERKMLKDFGANNEASGDMPMAATAPAPAAPSEMALGGLGAKGTGMGGGGLGALDGRAEPKTMKRMNTIQVIRGPQPAADKESDESSVEGGAPAATRAWFPETFLFEPLVVTDAQGKANVPVKVPDRLTTWRVLGLAHSRQGAQAGTVASLLGTLPTYVEPVAPQMLFAGDEVRLPVQVVNTTPSPVTSAFSVKAEGATLTAAGGSVTVPAQGSIVRAVTLATGLPGTATVTASLGGTDAMARSIAIRPAGLPQVLTHGGSLAAERTFSLTGPANALPGSESVRLQVFPGALGLLRSELSAAPGRGGVAEDAYLLELLGQAPALLKSLGATAADDTIRDLSVVATQRAMRDARGPSVDDATLLTTAALAHPQNPVLARLGERLADQVARAQRPDGTCQGANGWTLQRLLVTTADCVRAAGAASDSAHSRQRAAAVQVKASGAFERNAARITDGYTAAAVLASGAVTGTVADKLKEVLVKALTDGADGAKQLVPETGVVRADGLRPSVAEATALAILALEGDAHAPLADLGTTLLAGYSPVYGWGDGRANLVALKAVVHLFKDPLPREVKVTLSRDGKALSQGVLSAETLTQVVTMEAPSTGSSGEHQWTVKAEPPVPGLGFSFSSTAYVPWRNEPGGGLELITTLPKELKVGHTAVLKLTGASPAQLGVTLKVGLPAGVQVVTPQLSELVNGGQVRSFETEDGSVTLHLPPHHAGETLALELQVVPTFAGKLQAAPSSMMVEGRNDTVHQFAPAAWAITD